VDEPLEGQQLLSGDGPGEGGSVELDTEYRTFGGVFERLVVVGADWGEAGPDSVADFMIGRGEGGTPVRFCWGDDWGVVKGVVNELGGKAADGSREGRQGVPEPVEGDRGGIAEDLLSLDKTMPSQEKAWRRRSRMMAGMFLYASTRSHFHMQAAGPQSTTE
jgi:hypothetical protein